MCYLPSNVQASDLSEIVSVKAHDTSISFRSGLMDNPPPSIQQEVSPLVKQCAFPE